MLCMTGAPRDHLETFLTHARENYARPLPAYVEQELRAYLRCGVFGYGFTRCHCDACGHDVLVAFSCKGRGLCPSCAGRRMANTGAHLVDRVVPVRQLVLSIPYELRMLAAFKPDALTALSRIFVEVTLASYRARAKELHRIDRGVTGAVTLVQRLRGSLNLNVHFHLVFLDGVFTRDAQNRVSFHLLPPPEHDELDAIVRRIHKRALAWLKRRGYIDNERERDAEPGAIEACAAIAMQRGSFTKLTEDDPTPIASEEPKLLPCLADHEGWNLHAGVAIPAGDDIGRERLLRYGARPPLALDRLRHLRDGRIGYRIKYSRTGSKYRVMTGLDILARLAALIPPPRYPLVRFHGVLGPRSAWRKDVVPKPRTLAACEQASRDGDARRPRGGKAPEPGRAEDRAPERSAPRAWEQQSLLRDETTLASSIPHALATSEFAAPNLAPAMPPLASVNGLTVPSIEGRRDADRLIPTILLAPNIISLRHWNRLAEGALYAASRRIAWGPLLRRTFAVDVQRCPKCHGRLRVIGTVLDPVAAHAILSRLALPTAAPALARARDPTELVWSELEEEPQGA
jgi:Putative transposase/Transposase zinc-binding domain